MTVDIDVLLFENFIVNLFLLFITSETLRYMIKIKYAIFASILGSLYVITMLFDATRLFTTLPFKMIVAFLIIIIGFNCKDKILNFKAFILYILYSMLLAGICIFFEFNSYHGSYNYILLNKYSYKKLLLSIMIVYIIINRTVIYVRDRKNITELIYEVDIYIDNKLRRVKAFLDTGNELREPATNLPVLLVEEKVLAGIDISKFDIICIPYKTVDGTIGNIRGIKPKYIGIHIGSQIQRRQVILGFCNNKISNSNEYDALLSRGII